MLGIAKIDQRVEPGNRLKDDIPALAAIAAVRAAIFDVFFTPECDSTGAASTGTDENLGLIEKMHDGITSLFVVPSRPTTAASHLLKICPTTGGAEGDRTPDLVIANDALSQLSYGPGVVRARTNDSPRERFP